MENKFKEFWIELEEKGARAFVYTEPVDGLNDDAIHTVEYAALESANDKIAELKEDIREDRVKPDDYLYLATINKRLESENKKLTDEIARLQHEWNIERTLHKTNVSILEKKDLENARLRAALEVYREFKIGIPHHNGAIIYLAESVLSGEGNEG